LAFTEMVNYGTSLTWQHCCRWRWISFELTVC